MMPGAFAPTSLDLDCDCSIECICKISVFFPPLVILFTHSHNVMKRYMFGLTRSVYSMRPLNFTYNSHNQRNFCFNRFLDRCSSLMRSYIDTSRVWLQLLHCCSDRWEHGFPQVLPRAIWLHASNHVSSPIHRLFRIGGCLSAGKSLKDNFGVGADPKIMDCIIVAIVS
jgi:hypothetical protein